MTRASPTPPAATPPAATPTAAGPGARHTAPTGRPSDRNRPAPPPAVPPALSPAAPPTDLRLLPAALAAWGAALAAVVAGWGVGVLVTAAGLVAAVAAGTRLRSARRSTGARRTAGARHPAGRTATRDPAGRAAGVLAVGACAAAVGLVASVSAYGVTAHPLRSATGARAAVTVDLVLTDDPTPVRSTAPSGAASVVVRADVIAGEVGGLRWRAGGRVVVLAPAESWSGLSPGQAATARGVLAPPERADLTVAVVRTRAPPTAVGPVPESQQVAGALRAGLRDASRAVLDEEPGALLPGLVVGDTGAMPGGLADDFRTAGLTHLIAVSGTNLAIVAGAVLLLARAGRLGPRTSAVLAGLALVGFVVLVRPSPSVLRAAVMGALTVLALATGRRRSVVPALCTAVVVLVLVDPGLAVDPGFALSVLATGALVLLAPPMVERLRARRVPPGIAEALVVPVAAQVVTAPVVAALSSQVSLVAVVANLLAAPVVAPATVLGVLAAVVAPVWTGGAQGLVWLAGPEVSWLVWVGRRCAAVPGAVVAWPGGVMGGVGLAAALVLVVVLLRWRRLRAAVVAASVGALLVLVPTRVAPPGWPPAAWSVVACDVGQGDALVLATGEPGRAVLVDAGPDAGAVDACLSRLGVRSLALVVLSHLHADHVGGLAGAMRGRAVSAVAIGPSQEPASSFAQLTRRAGTAGAAVVELSRGATLAWPALSIEVLGPLWAPARPVGGNGTAASSGTAVNDTSVMLRARTPVGRVLLPGDAESAPQSTVLATGVDVRADILKVPHHGSRSSSAAFLVAAQAPLALVSVGRGNTYGHPNPGTMAVLAGTGALVRRTDESGDLAVVAARDGPAVVSRGDPRPDPRRR